ncbi:MAG: hypothetical protein IKU27_08705, partial [Clostridia bacterium]|nr:hypothetical protein [Clostridia bacterium]
YTGAEYTLGIPTDLQWHKEAERINGSYQLVERMGSMAFKRPVDDEGNFLDQSRYEYEIYEITENGDDEVHSGSWSYSSTTTRAYFDMVSFIYEDLPSGTYYFRVRARGDGINYNHGPWVESEPWTFVKPDAQLNTPTNPAWNDTDFTDYNGSPYIAATWDSVEGAGYYEVDFYFAKNEKATLRRLGGTFDIRADETLETRLWEDQIEEYGPGLYYFEVRAIAKDITKKQNSEWSVMSPAYDLRDTASNVNDQLDQLLSSGDIQAPSASQIQAAVSEIELLDEVMAADAAKGNTGTLDKLAQLEEMIKEELDVETGTAVSGSLAERFDGAMPEIGVANMALNIDMDKAAEATETTQVTLNVADAKGAVNLPETLIDTQKNNTMVFSMDIPNAKDANPEAPGRQLLVPVQITLPIPADINRSFLVVLHEKSDGTWEELFMPHIFEKNGQWYATFNVTSFSNFAFGERAVTAVAEGRAVTIETAHLPTCGEDTQFICAVYSQEGQMLGMEMFEPWAESEVEIVLDQPVPAGAYLKIFAVDSGNGWTVPSDAIEA